MLSSKSLGRCCWDFGASTLGILDELTGAAWGLDFPSFSRGRKRGLGKGEKETYGGSLIRPTVGFSATYRRVVFGVAEGGIVEGS